MCFVDAERRVAEGFLFWKLEFSFARTSVAWIKNAKMENFPLDSCEIFRWKWAIMKEELFFDLNKITGFYQFQILVGL